MVRGACGEPERERECEPVRPPPPAAAVRATDSVFEPRRSGFAKRDHEAQGVGLIFRGGDPLPAPRFRAGAAGAHPPAGGAAVPEPGRSPRAAAVGAAPTDSLSRGSGASERPFPNARLIAPRTPAAYKRGGRSDSHNEGLRSGDARPRRTPPTSLPLLIARCRGALCDRRVPAAVICRESVQGILRLGSRYQLMEKTSLKTVPGPNSTRSHPSVHLHWDFTCVGICEFPFFCSSAWISERWH
ncbi:uncharacterized protein LOC124417858 [Gallus gallus]|uniref:uncharacterized protein LOC124417858 n=1 Tax=Gallus gallus TaxID=9031 RepID=UPI001F01A46E|nr:uncharacterized protein LOC124417858 [Gallus gallus]